MALLSKKDTKLIMDPLSDNNPITVQVLGICSALAITAELEASVVMSVSVLFVMGVGNVVISMMSPFKDLRDKLNQDFEKKGKEYILLMLKKIDPKLIPDKNS